MCVFKDNTGNEWCFKFQSPVLTSGWKWSQATSDGYFRYQFVPYFKPAFYLTSDFTIQRVWDSTVSFSIPEFTTEMYYSFTFSQTGQICLGIGWSSGTISLKTQGKFTQKDCYKTLFNDLCDWSNWTGDRAMWLDYCANEASPVTVTISNWQVGKSISN